MRRLPKKILKKLRNSDGIISPTKVQEYALTGRILTVEECDNLRDENGCVSPSKYHTEVIGKLWDKQFRKGNKDTRKELKK